MLIYKLRVSIIGIPNVYRILDASENCTFDDLHEAIFEAFDRFDPHLYSFYLTKKDTKNIRTIFRSPEITLPDNMDDFLGLNNKEMMSSSETVIGDLGLAEKDVFHYIFDFGDEWWHRIRVQSIKEGRDNRTIIELSKSVGKSPEQYPEGDDDFFDDEDE